MRRSVTPVSKQDANTSILRSLDAISFASRLLLAGPFRLRSHRTPRIATIGDSSSEARVECKPDLPPAAGSQRAYKFVSVQPGAGAEGHGESG